DRAKAWFMTLAPGSLATWTEVYSKFIGRYYSHQKTQELRSQIVSFAQLPNESLHEAWERFKDLQRQCPHHNLSPGLLMNCFYDSLHQNLQYMVDNAAGGDIGARTAEEMFEIFETMSTNSSQKSTRGKRAVVNEVGTGNDAVAQQLAELTEQMRLLTARGSQPVNTFAIDTCGACGVPGHRSEVCPSSFEQDPSEQYADASALQGYQNRPANDPYSNTYNPGWRNHPHFSWSNNSNTLQPPRPNFMQQQPRPSFNMPSYGKFFKDLVTKKRKFEDGEKVVVYEAASAMQHDLPKKERDPSGFIIQIALGNGKVASGMLNLGAGINLMPFSIFQRLGLGDLRPTRMCLQLADRSIRYPKGIVEDVLVKVGKLIIPVDFVVLDVGDVHENGKDHTILLGRPFMATTNTLIDVKNDTLNMTVLGESVSISVRGAMSSSSVNFIEECAFIDISDPFVDKMV
ncbi:Unknown protein, partial [Striga hermonthica]